MSPRPPQSQEVNLTRGTSCLPSSPDSCRATGCHKGKKSLQSGASWRRGTSRAPWSLGSSISLGGHQGVVDGPNPSAQPRGSLLLVPRGAGEGGCPLLALPGCPRLLRPPPLHLGPHPPADSPGRASPTPTRITAESRLAGLQALCLGPRIPGAASGEGSRPSPGGLSRKLGAETG